jgi:hypothetical protein
MADTPELGRALAEFAAACSLMAQPSGPSVPAPSPNIDDAVPAFLGRAARAESARAPIRVDSENAPSSAPTPTPAAPAPTPTPAAPAPTPAAVPAARATPTQSPLQAEDTVMELERRLGLRGPES